MNLKFTRPRLMLVAVILVLAITALPAVAGQGIGASPYAADLLMNGLNTGTLNPGQEHWYAYSQADLGDAGYNSVILSLNSEADGQTVASRVNFQVFNFTQVEAWLEDNSSPVDSLGLGIPASADFDPNTSERLWAGLVAPGEVYYVRIFNLSPSPIRFRLTALGQKSAQFMAHQRTINLDQPPAIPAAISMPGGPASISEPSGAPSSMAGALPTTPAVASTNWLLAAQAIDGLPPEEAAVWLMSAAALGWLDVDGAAAVPVNPNPQPPVAAPPPVAAEPEVAPAVLSPPPEIPAPSINPDEGYSIYPNHPLILLAGPNTGRLGPKSEHWYTFTFPKGNDDKLFQDLALTMFFTPGEANISRHVTFEMFTGSQYQIWERGTPEDMEYFGVGSWVSRDGDYNTGERLWRGPAITGDQYFVRVLNDTDLWIDYHLIPGDIVNTELGPPSNNDKAKPAAASIQATLPTGKDIGAPLPIGEGHRQGTLTAGEDLWFSFEHRNTRPDEFEFLHYQIELHHRPGYGNVANYVNVEVYPFQEQHLWRRGDTDKITPLGAGSDTSYDRATDTHLWAWDGHLVSNTIYFIRVRNDSSADIDYDLSIQRP